MSKREVFIVAAARTPIGSFQGALAEVPAVRLGATAISAALARSGLSADDVQETYMGNVLTAGEGQAPARQAARFAGIPDRVPATTVGKVCGSGLQAVILGTKSILLGDADVVVAGGMESMSQAPYLLPQARGGFRMGNGQVVDSMIHDGLWDPYKNFHMGVAGELCVKENGFTRKEQDDFAMQSYQRALSAMEKGEFAAEIAEVRIEGKKGDAVVVKEDEEPRRAKLDKMGSLKPAFDPKEGTITAANASKINDGASAVILASGETVKKKGLTPIARVVGYGAHAQAPEWFTTAPVGAIENALARTGLAVGDVDLFEVNEAFAVVAMVTAKKAGIDPAKMNVRGGAVALGHPIGASGARVLTTLVHAMKDRSAKRGLATLCIGGGEAVAVIVERV
ncbi:thiolase family protein [Sandaracinus amylolyticus]|uniref:3-ketoacyl-CoA thiolase n=1 Tax=Sandaracinus amylolyticus TaxID=927083 RepID=A0A0F6W4F2_9BACT|nr:acetyl-CoA C-acetyltransferase [Sandaracinus amylolyticus]AKF07027.1 3-ketoacyl-CoA thiolase [Sandaracinus amylolyticus]